MECSYIIVVRNPGTRRLFAVTRNADDALAEYKSEAEATADTANIPVCRAWPYYILEVI